MISHVQARGRAAVVGAVVAVLALTFAAAAFARANAIHIHAYPPFSHEYQIVVKGYARKAAWLEVYTGSQGCPATPAGLTTAVHHSFKYVRYSGTSAPDICVYLVSRHTGRELLHKFQTA